MRDIEQKPIPTFSKGLTGDLKRLKKPTDSFLIENKGLKRAVLYSTASRLKIRLITRLEPEGLRVWRNFDTPEAIESPVLVEDDELPMSHKEKIEALKDLANLAASGVSAGEIYAEPVSELPIADPMWVDAGEHWNEIQGEMVAMERHVKTGKFREKV